MEKFLLTPAEAPAALAIGESNLSEVVAAAKAAAYR